MEPSPRPAPPRRIAAAAALALLSAAIIAVPRPPAARADATNPALQMALGNPDKATAGPTDAARYLIRRPQYALSYNDRLRFPNWVAWHLSRRDIGDLDRGQFQPDPSLPTGFTRITPGDYTRSGYDRGHNCPSKDRTADRAANEAVFLMTNITPQMHGMNAGPWGEFEQYCRDLTGEGNELFLYCGHGFNKGPRKTIGRAKVAVPDFGWKIAVVVPPGRGTAALSRITPTTRVIAVRMPNISTIANKDWREFRTSVADIEAATGLRFFDALPPATAKALKERVDFDRSAPSRLRTDKNDDAAPPSAPASGGGAGKVWVNTRSGAYWRPGTQFYGKTKQGRYMTEDEARKAGYHPAGGQ